MLSTFFIGIVSAVISEIAVSEFGSASTVAALEVGVLADAVRRRKLTVLEGDVIDRDVTCGNRSNTNIYD